MPLGLEQQKRKPIVSIPQQQHKDSGSKLDQTLGRKHRRSLECDLCMGSQKVAPRILSRIPLDPRSPIGVASRNMKLFKYLKLNKSKNPVPESHQPHIITGYHIEQPSHRHLYHCSNGHCCSKIQTIQGLWNRHHSPASQFSSRIDNLLILHLYLNRNLLHTFPFSFDQPRFHSVCLSLFS